MFNDYTRLRQHLDR